MKKILISALVATTALVSAQSAMATAYTSAAAVRDGLTTVYDDLDGTFNTSAAGVEYAELLYRIDNIGTATPIVLAIDPVTGHINATGGDLDGLFTLDEVLAQVDTFVEDLNNDMFGNTTGNDLGTGDVDLDGSAHDGLMGTQLNTIIALANAANAVLTNAASTNAEREAAVATFNAGFATESVVFNNAVDVLGNIADTVTVWEATDVAGFQGSAWDLQSATEATSSTATDAAIPTGGFGITYSAYSTYVADGDVTWTMGSIANGFSTNSKWAVGGNQRINSSYAIWPDGTNLTWSNIYGTSVSRYDSTLITVDGTDYSVVEMTRTDGQVYYQIVGNGIANHLNSVGGSDGITQDRQRVAQWIIDNS